MRRVMEVAYQVERAYGLAHGTIRRLFEAGRIRGQMRPGRGRMRRALWVRVEDVDAIFGGEQVA